MAIRHLRPLRTEPDGVNINAGCGSTHLRPLQEAVEASGAALGVALDGDADRVLAVDHEGEIVDGDQLLAMFAFDLLDRGLLAGGSIVVTVMSNLGLRHALAAAGHRGRRDPRRRPPRQRRHRGQRPPARRRAVRPPRLPPLRDDRRRHPDRPPAVRARRPHRPRLAELAGDAMTRLPQVLRNVHVARPGAPGTRATASGTRCSLVESRARRQGPRAVARVRHRGRRPGHGRGADATSSPPRWSTGSSRSSFGSSTPPMVPAGPSL